MTDQTFDVEITAIKKFRVKVLDEEVRDGEEPRDVAEEYATEAFYRTTISVQDGTVEELENDLTVEQIDRVQ